MMTSHSASPKVRACYPYTGGFTILELLVASTVFAIILLVVATGVIRFTDSYYKGITESKTQSASREIMNEISQSIQFGKSFSSLTGASGVQGICTDNTLYSYKVGQQVTDSSPNAGLNQDYHGLVVSTGGACAGATPSLPNGSALPANSRELLGQHMRLSSLTVTNSGDLYTIRVRVIYGDNDLLTPVVTGSTNWALEKCSSGPGTQFCAVSDLNTTVQRRLL